MKIHAIAFSVIVLLGQKQSTAFVPSVLATTSGNNKAALFASVDTAKTSKKAGGASVELGIPCEEECALEKFPKLPASIYPGVLSGQAQVDLLNHAKENGTCFIILIFKSFNLKIWYKLLFQYDHPFFCHCAVCYCHSFY